MYSSVECEYLTAGLIGWRTIEEKLPDGTHRMTSKSISVLGSEYLLPPPVATLVRRHDVRGNLQVRIPGTLRVRYPDREQHLIRSVGTGTLQHVELMGVDLESIRVDVLDEAAPQWSPVDGGERVLLRVVHVVRVRRWTPELKREHPHRSHDNQSENVPRPPSLSAGL